jgi:hypothetical protein
MEGKMPGERMRPIERRHTEMMQPLDLDPHIWDAAKIPVEPAFREITAGLERRVIEMLRDPSKLGISCCFEGCCVSWCCIRIT